MRQLVYALLCVFALVAIWYGGWRWIVSGDVARVKASIAYQNQQFKTANRYVVFKADSVEPIGFPLHFKVRVVRPTLSMVSGKETFAVSFPKMLLVPEDAAQGRYELKLWREFEALYAVDGQAPENYRITMDAKPHIQVRAQGNSKQCGGLVGGNPCDPVASDAPLVSYTASLPESIILHVTLNDEVREIRFDAMPVNVPLFLDIPKSVDRPLEIFVRMLREAVFHDAPIRRKTGDS